jgi:hypothetical protein
MPLGEFRASAQHIVHPGANGIEFIPYPEGLRLPNPGTVVFAGYGNTLANAEDDPRTARLRRTVDGLFVKVSYLFRL